MMAPSQLLGVLAPNILVPGSKTHLIDFVVSFPIALVLLLLRVVAEKTILPRVRKALGKHKAKAAFQVFDNAWIAAFAGGLTAFAWYVTIKVNGDCTPWAADNCFLQWPNHPLVLPQRWYMILAFAYYLYELIGLVVGVGTKLKGDMIAHHIVTMALILIAYEVNLIRMSVMWQALFDLSNPILHTAKGLHALALPPLETLKWLMFNLFALTFLTCRVLAGPYSILWPSFTTAVTVLPMSYCYTCWGLMVFVYLLQLVWFYKIVQIAVKGEAAVPKQE